MIGALNLAAAAVLSAGFPAAPASVGVGIQANPVCLAAAAQPGHGYPLGTVYVVNTGSGSESVSLKAETPFNGLKGQHVPPSWVGFGYPRLLLVIGQDSVSLGAGQSAYIPVTVSVPAGARPGMYGADLVAGTVAAAPSGSGGHAVFGAGAETDLEFAVAPGPPPSCNPDPAVKPGPKVPASAYAPAAATSPGAGTKLPSDWDGYAILIALFLLAAAGLRKWMRS
jgi:hypothetical protein